MESQGRAVKPEDVPAAARDKCRTCRAEVIWTWTEAGKDMPVDLAPGGYVTVDNDGNPRTVPPNLSLNATPGGVVKSRVVKPHLAFGNPHLHLSHFVRCPQSKSWRRNRSYTRKAGK